jgi:glyoxylase-like metal-dependent hydrolase (beta-lactamase superfamily II)
MRHPSSLFFDTAAPAGKIPGKTDGFASSLNVFLLETKEGRYLIDAGHDQARGSLRQKLTAGRIPPESIRAVFITHIHPDHVGGLLWDGKPLFPNAEIYIAEKEYKGWQKDERRAGLAKYIAPYEKRLKLFDGKASLPGGLTPILLPGHTPGHTVYQFSPAGKEGGCAYFVGDILHAVELQVPRPTVCARYDSEPAAAVQSRKALFLLAEKSSLPNTIPVIFGAHFPFPGCARLHNGEYLAFPAKGKDYGPNHN